MSADVTLDPSKLSVNRSGPSSDSSKKAALVQSTKFKVGVVIGAIVLIFIGRWAYGLLTTETTDDAFVTSRVHQVSTRVQGQVLAVNVGDNQKVKAGDVLVTLDPREFEANVKSAQAKYSKAHKDLGRMSGYGGFLPDEKPILDQYQADALSSEAMLQESTLQYEFTKIIAPADGTIGSRNVETGQLVVPGQALLALVEPNPWIVANFKEGQLSKIRVGQRVEIEVDAIPGHTFEGTVDSVSPGSGATFSLLPPDNATGNFTKVVQRVSVKITFNKEALKGFEDRVVAGLSSYVSIKVN
jgi:membrane fusion protein (multidrug efflux system)